MKMKPLFPPEPDNDISPSQENREMWPKDMLLRKHGYTIHSRSEKGEAVWKKGGKTYTETVALARLRNVEAEL